MPIVKASDAFAAARKWQRDHPQPKSLEMLAWEASWWREHGAEYDRVFGDVTPSRNEGE